MLARVSFLASALFGVATAQTDLYSTNGSLNSVTVTDTVTRTVVATIPVGASPLDIAFSPDGTRAYTANFYGGSVSVIDTQTRSVVATVPVGSYPSGIGVSRDGTKYYVVRDYNGEVRVHSTATNALLGTLPVPATNGGFGSVTFTADGARAYITAGNVTVLDTATDQVVTQFGAGFCANLAITPDGARVYCVDGWQGAVYGFSTTTHALLSTTFVGGLPSSIAITRDGSKAFVAVPAYLAGIQGSFAAAPQRVVQTIDLTTNLVNGTLITTHPPGGIASVIDGSRICIAVPLAGQVVEVDPVTNAFGLSYAAGPRPSTLVMAPIPATATAYGTACPTPTGPVTLAASSLPWLGTTHTVTANGLSASALPLGVFGFASGALPLASVLSFALPGCDLLAEPAVLSVLANQSGSAVMATALPNAAGLAGLVVFQQVLQLDANGLSASNGVQAVLGTW